MAGFSTLAAARLLAAKPAKNCQATNSRDVPARALPETHIAQSASAICEIGAKSERTSNRNVKAAPQNPVTRVAA